MAERVETSLRVGDRWIHRFQVVRERAEDGSTREWVVVGLAPAEDAIDLASPDFEWSVTVPVAAVRSGRYEPVTAGDVPVWGY